MILMTRPFLSLVDPIKNALKNFNYLLMMIGTLGIFVLKPARIAIAVLSRNENTLSKNFKAIACF